MKNLKYFFIIIFIFSIYNCDKNDNEEVNALDVATFVELLKRNEYDSLNIPAFTYTDIPLLLHYRNENHIITDFPHNPISSLFMPECKLGIYVLWTIESIRAVSINSDYLVMRFPSQNPVLQLKDFNELNLVSDDLSHSVASEAYFNWWENNRGKDFNNFKNIDPLKDTDYRWH